MKILTTVALVLGSVLGLAGTAGAQDLSAALRDKGLAGTIADLQAIPDPDAATLFTLAGAQFLRGVERSLQARYIYGMTGDRIDLPVLRLQVPPNPNPEPFRNDLVRDIFTGLQSDMARARATLERIGDADFGAEIALGDIWFDINGNGTRDTGEAVAAQFAATLGLRGQPGAGATLPVIRFDSADAAWLAAYTHFLSGISGMVLAFDPTEAIRQTRAEAAEMARFMDLAPPNNAYDYLFADEADTLTMVYRALQNRPDRAHLAAARTDILAMIRLNQTTWARIGAETDNDREWLPSPSQTSGLGVTVPPETGPAWAEVLADAEALLTGQKLIPHWRYGAAAGINLARMIEDGPAVDIVGWAQGGGLLPYAEQGDRVTAVSMRRFDRMMRGNTLLFALFLN